MFYVNQFLKSLDINKELEYQKNSLDNFRKIIRGKTVNDIKEDLNILIEGNHLFFDKTRTFPVYSTGALLDSGRNHILLIKKHCGISSIKSFLDIGCGRGQLSCAAVDDGCEEAVGIDLKRFSSWDEFRKGRPSLTYYKMDITKDVLDRKFHLVTSIAAFEHFEFPEEMLEKMCTYVQRGDALHLIQSYLAKHRWTSFIPLHTISLLSLNIL